MTITTVMRTISRPPSSQPSQLEEDVDDGAAEGAVDTGARVAGEDCRVGAVVVPDVDAVAGAGDCAGAGVGDGVGGGSWVGISVGIIASERVGRVIEVRGGRDEDSSGSEDRDGAAVIETVGSSPVGRVVGAGSPPPSHAAMARPRTVVTSTSRHPALMCGTRARNPGRRSPRAPGAARCRPGGAGWFEAPGLMGGACRAGRPCRGADL